MNKSTINKLLNKKGWTGKEVGQALMASFIYDMKKHIKGTDGDNDTLFSQEDLSRMEASLDNDARQWKIYSSYTSVYSGLVHAVNFGSAKVQQFLHAFYRNLLPLQEATEIEVSLSQFYKQPIIMTRQQYDRLAEAVKKEHRATAEPFGYVLMAVIRYYIENEEAEAPEGIREALNALKDKPCTNQRIIDNHNIDNEIGYFIDKDGNKSDSQYEEWKATALNELDDLKGSVAIKICELIFKGWEAVRDYFKEDELTEEEAKRITSYLASIKGMEEEPEDLTDREIAIIEKLLGARKKPETHFKFEEAPANLSKYDALYYDIDRYFGQYDYRHDAKTGEDLNEISEAEQFEEFKADYPDLYKSVFAYIKKLFPKKATACSQDVESTLGSWGELADKGVADYVEWTTPEEEDIIGKYLDEHKDSGLSFADSVARHIAIIEKPASFQIDVEGNYKEDTLKIIANSSLEAIAEKATPDSPESIKEELLKGALSYFYSLIELAGIIEDVYEVKDLQDTIRDYVDTKDKEDKVYCYNNIIYLLNTIFYGNDETKARKRELLHATFTPIEIEDYKPKQEDIETVRTSIELLRSKAERLDNIQFLYPYIETLQGRG